MRIISTKNQEVVIKGTRDFVVGHIKNTEGWRSDYLEAVDRMAEHSGIGPTPEEAIDWQDSDWDNYCVRAERAFDKDFVNNWNRYTEDWPSPRGVEPVYEALVV